MVVPAIEDANGVHSPMLDEDPGTRREAGHSVHVDAHVSDWQLEAVCPKG